MSRGKDTSARARTFSRRTVLLGAGGLSVYGALVTRLWSLQVVEAEEFATLSKDNQFNHTPVAPPRGRILDRYGRVVADNAQTYEIRLTPHRIADVDATLKRLAELVDPVEAAESRVAGVRRERRIARWSREVRRARRFDTVVLDDNAEWEGFARVNLHRPDLPGVSAETGEARIYGLLDPETGAYDDADAFAHVIGYVAKPNEDVIDDRLSQARTDQGRQALARILRHPAYRAGRAGIELTYDDALQGEWGEKRIEVDAFGRTIREIGLDREANAGRDLQLTLDAKLQVYAQRRLDGESAAVVGLNVRTGEILIMASAPGFDPNRFAKGISSAAYRALVNDPRTPLYNKPLAGLYPPGSTFKAITALACLRAGVVNPAERVFCSGEMRLGNRIFHCWKRGGHGSMNLRDALKKSCDTYFYEISRRVGIDPIAAEARRFGLGQTWDLDVPGARAGIVPDEAWKRAVVGEPWAGGETLVASIGQGFTNASPLQLAVMAARLATNTAVTPTLVRRDLVPDFTIGGPLVDPAHLTRINDAHYAVAEEPGGTAYWSLGTKGLDVPGVRMAGKTGTSQVRRITLEERRTTGVVKNEELPWKFRDHALFIAHAPFDNPKYAVALIIEHGGSGSKAASPPARDILAQMVRSDPELVVASREGQTQWP